MASVSRSFIVAAKRTPVGRYGGALSSCRPDDLAAHVMKAVIDEANIDPTCVNEVVFGNANGAGEENRNVARLAWIIAGFPDTVPGITVNRLCASGMSSISLAQAMIGSGQADVVVAGGVESMSRAPWVLAKPETPFAKPGEIFDTSIGWRFVNPVLAKSEKTTFSMPETAEEVARIKNISRERADKFAAESQKRAVNAIEAGHFDWEITPVPVAGRKGVMTTVSNDEGPRPGTTVEILSNLRPVVRGGSVVTAGNSSSLNDGASAVIVASADACDRLGLTPLAEIVDFAAAGLAPEVMGLGPIPATKKLLARTGWDLQSVGAIELNEAFATQSLACIDELELNPAIVNAWGGAIALGHPLGSSGARITITLLNRMRKEGVERGIATMCVGVGQGTAIALQAV